MTKTTLIFAALSVLVPAVSHAFAFALGELPARAPFHGALPILAAHITGLAFSVISFARSNEKPTNISAMMQAVLFLSGIGLLGNTIAIQLLLSEILHVTAATG